MYISRDFFSRNTRLAVGGGRRGVEESNASCNASSKNTELKVLLNELSSHSPFSVHLIDIKLSELNDYN